MTEHSQRLLDVLQELRTAVAKQEQTQRDTVFCPKAVYQERWGTYGWNCSDCIQQFKPIYPDKGFYEECPCYNIGSDPSFQVTREEIVARLDGIIRHIGDNM